MAELEWWKNGRVESSPVPAAPYLPENGPRWRLRPDLLLGWELELRLRGADREELRAMANRLADVLSAPERPEATECPTFGLDPIGEPNYHRSHELFIKIGHKFCPSCGTPLAPRDPEGA